MESIYIDIAMVEWAAFYHLGPGMFSIILLLLRFLKTIKVQIKQVKCTNNFDYTCEKMIYFLTFCNISCHIYSLVECIGYLMGLSLLGVRFTASTDLEKWPFKVNKKGDNIHQNECLNNLSYSIISMQHLP